MAELFPSLEQELTNFEVFGIQIDTTYVSCVWYKALRCFSYMILQCLYQLSGSNACPCFSNYCFNYLLVMSATTGWSTSVRTLAFLQLIYGSGPSSADTERRYGPGWLHGGCSIVRRFDNPKVR